MASRIAFTGFLLVFFTMGSLTWGGRTEDIDTQGAAKFKHVVEWSRWKLKHAKSYGSELEELERHLIWLSEKKYIDHHNANSHIFGFTLAMNHLGDMVSIYILCTCTAQ